MTAATPSPSPEVLAAFEAAKGFMPVHEGLALYAAATEAGALGLPLLEVGTYCGRSTILLADAARTAGVSALTVDHHRGSEEQQPGWEYHDPTVVDPEVGLMDTLPTFRRTLHRAGLEEHVVALVGRSPQVAAVWAGPLGLVFIDGGHTDEHANGDYEGWAPHVAEGGLLVIHDVFPEPADGGQAPYRVYLRALASGAFTEVSVTDSLRVLRRTGAGSEPYAYGAGRYGTERVVRVRERGIRDRRYRNRSSGASGGPASRPPDRTRKETRRPPRRVRIASPRAVRRQRSPHPPCPPLLVAAALAALCLTAVVGCGGAQDPAGTDTGAAKPGPEAEATASASPSAPPTESRPSGATPTAPLPQGP